MTTVTKALGGPKKAIAIVGTGVAIVGYGVIRGLEAGGKKIHRIAASARHVPCPTVGRTFTVAADAEAGGGLTFRTGEKYRVLACDGDAIQIEVIGRPDNPYFVSGELLPSISDYPGEKFWPSDS